MRPLGVCSRMAPGCHWMALCVGQARLLWQPYKFRYYFCDMTNCQPNWPASQAAYFSAISPQKLICKLAREPVVGCIWSSTGPYSWTMDPCLSSGMEVSPTIAFTVSNCRPGFGLFCTWISHCDETAAVGDMGDGANRPHSYQALRNWSQIPGGPYTLF